MALRTDADLFIALRAERRQLKKDLAMARRDVGSFSKGVSVQASKIASSLGAAFGGALVIQGISAGIKKIAQFEFQMDKVAAVSGATQSEIKELTRNAQDLGAKSRFTATEIAKLQEELARLGFGTDQIINMTDAARKLAQVADADLGESAKILGKQLNAFNLSAKDSAEVANIMAESFSKSALDLEQFGVAMSFAGASGKAFGLNLAQVTGMVGVLVDNGIQATKAGSGLRDIFADLTKKGMSLEEAIRMVSESEDGFATALDLVGKTSANQLLILAENQKKVVELTAALSDSNKEMEAMVKTMEDNLLTDFELLKSALDGLVQKGGIFNGTLRKTTQGLTGVVTAVNELDTRRIREFFQSILAGGATIPVLFDKWKVEDRLKELKDAAPVGPQSLIEMLGLPPLKESNDIAEGIKKISTSVKEVKKDLSDTSLMPKGFEDAGIPGLVIAPRIDKEAVQKLLDDSKMLVEQLQMQLVDPFIHLGDEISVIASDAISGFVETFSQTGKLQKGFRTIFQILGQGLSNMGKGLIAQGVAIKALISLDPFTKIAAGVAAVAAGALISRASGGISSGVAAAAGVSGGGGGRSLSGQASITIPDKVIMEANGDSLQAVLELTQRNQGRTRG